MYMNLKRTIMVLFLTTGLFAGREVLAQRTYEEMEHLTVNEQVTTVITASEPIRFVDISTEKIVGDQPIDNIIRLKPKEAGHEDGDILAIVTIVTERYRTQYALLYTTRMREAVTDKEVLLQEREAFNNPSVSMPLADMAVEYLALQRCDYIFIRQAGRTHDIVHFHLAVEIKAACQCFRRL